MSEVVDIPEVFALAQEHHRAGRLGAAEALYRQILARRPHHPGALHYLGVIAFQVGRHDLAIVSIRRALELQPADPAAHCNLGEAYRLAGRLEEAIASFHRALQLDPQFPDAWFNLGNAFKKQGQLSDAVSAYHRALDLQPRHVEALNNLGSALLAQNQLTEAEAAFRRAMALVPDYAEARNNLGTLLADQGQLDESATLLQQAIDLRRDYASAWYNLGTTEQARKHLDAALAAFRRALQLQPQWPEAQNNLGLTLIELGRPDEAVAAYRQARDLHPDDARAHSNLLHALHFHPRQDVESIAREQERWNEQFSRSAQQEAAPHANSPEPHRRLKIGYISPDFRSHAVAFFLTPLLEAHDHAAFEIYGYANVRRPDAVTARLRKSTDHWRDIQDFTDPELVHCIREDGIDILVDLAMHTAGNRLPALAHRPAPVQVTWLAYPGGTGVEAIDYRLTDAHLDPTDQTEPIGEKPVRLPDSWCCYLPIEDFPELVPSPASRGRAVTFGSLNQFRKIHDGLLHCWARLLKAVPATTLLMVCPHGQARERVRGLFAEYAIAPDRIEFVASLSWPEYVRLFERIDIALDSFPCNGMTTTCHALWMGVPVVTLAGTSAISRAGDSLLRAVGLPDWIARDEDDYLRLAKAAAIDLPKLVKLRRSLRSRMQASPLMDSRRFARNVEAAYRGLWQHWCNMTFR
jgi:predicted O-linked N-acetylglucosamine transferase (SPINDLY family)